MANTACSYYVRLSMTQLSVGDKSCTECSYVKAVVWMWLYKLWRHLLYRN